MIQLFLKSLGLTLPASLLTSTLAATALAVPPPPPPSPPPPAPASTALTAGALKVRTVGHHLSVSMRVTDQLGHAASGSAKCAARLSGRKVPVASQALSADGTATCVFVLPRHITHTRVTGTIAVSAGAATVTRPFATDLHS